jgi:hypothetical protein
VEKTIHPGDGGGHEIAFLPEQRMRLTDYVGFRLTNELFPLFRDWRDGRRDCPQSA